MRLKDRAVEARLLKIERILVSTTRRFKSAIKKEDTGDHQAGLVAQAMLQRRRDGATDQVRQGELERRAPPQEAALAYRIGTCDFNFACSARFPALSALIAGADVPHV